ncbi:hypothetical protein D3C72_196440 [compost metagenome]
MRVITLVVVSSLALSLSGCDIGALNGLLRPAPDHGSSSPQTGILTDPDDGTNVVPPGYLYLSWEFPRNGEERFESPVGDVYPLRVDVSSYQASIGARRWNRVMAYKVDSASNATGTVDATGRVVGTAPGGLAISASLGSGTARVLLAIKPADGTARRLSAPILLGHLPQSNRIIQSADEWTALLDGLEASRSVWILSDPGNDFASARALDIDFTTHSIVAVMVARGFRESQPALTHVGDDGKTVHVTIPGYHGFQSDVEPGVVPMTQGYFFSLPKLSEDTQVKVERLDTVSQ